MSIINKLWAGICTVFRQHQWENHIVLPRSYYDIDLEETRCRRCGDSIPIPRRFIDMGWWQGGCGGEKELLIRAMGDKK